MPRLDMEWDPNLESDAVEQWQTMEPEAYQDMVTGVISGSQDDVSILDWEEANSYAERTLHFGKTHRS